MDKASFYSRYADVILHSALKIKEGDVLSINTEEDDYAFARLIAEKAKKITGNGSYIQLLKNGRVVDEFDILSPFPLEKKPTLFLHLTYFNRKDDLKEKALFEARELQNYGLLSDPLGNPDPSLPFVTSYLPSPLWDEKMLSLDDEKESRALLESILSLEEEDYLERNDVRHENLLYKTKVLNELEIKECRITGDNGTDITFSFLHDSKFYSSYSSTLTKRFFSPYIFASDIFRLIDPKSISGWINITRPVVLWGREIRNLSLYYEEGILKDVRTDKLTEELFDLYLEQDRNASLVSMLTLSENSTPLSQEELTYIPELDRMRTVSLTLGGPKGEAVKEKNEENTVDSIVSLALPVGDESTIIIALTDDDEEIEIYSDGYIKEEF